ncbi:hypothetical protein [uncultured Clostridium sp.]|uniref:hypothetical protein n=1 Tax=uncultured Clostridium sp. TaxID=59620 RepID=UPI0025FA76B5|nr:hypothetical protein [uncultured Clostridium sp.]
MGLDAKKNPILYSIGTNIAYKIAIEYYNDVHFVWCTTKFNSLEQPSTSNPAEICKSYLKQITKEDRHMYDIYNNMVGILNGARVKLNNGIISKRDFEQINNIVASVGYDAFFPVLYIIESKKVASHCIEVKTNERASDKSVEYRIEDLKRNEFEIIFFKDILSGIVNISEKRVGE